MAEVTANTLVVQQQQQKQIAPLPILVKIKEGRDQATVNSLNQLSNASGEVVAAARKLNTTVTQTKNQTSGAQQLNIVDYLSAQTSSTVDAAERLKEVVSGTLQKVTQSGSTVNLDLEALAADIAATTEAAQRLVDNASLSQLRLDRGRAINLARDLDLVAAAGNSVTEASARLNATVFANQQKLDEARELRDQRETDRIATEEKIRELDEFKLARADDAEFRQELELKAQVDSDARQRDFELEDSRRRDRNLPRGSVVDIFA